MSVNHLSRLAACAVGLVMVAVLPGRAMADPAEVAGEAKALGEGLVQSFARIAEDGRPEVIGLRFDDAALRGLPAEPNLTSRCFDADGDGQIGARECIGDLEVRLALPKTLAGRADIPLKWAMINWNPVGHPPAAWSVPHFDVHFYRMAEAEVDAMRPGKCGELIDCEDFVRATMPVAAQFVHPDHVNVDAVVPAMGNHLIDAKTPELGDPAKPFTHTWIFGAYEGKIIFDEVMLAYDYMKAGSTGCHDIKQPKAWQVGGWHATRYCIDYDEEEQVHEISLQEFVLRTATEKMTIAPAKKPTHKG